MDVARRTENETAQVARYKIPPNLVQQQTIVYKTRADGGIFWAKGRCVYKHCKFYCKQSIVLIQVFAARVFPMARVQCMAPLCSRVSGVAFAVEHGPESGYNGPAGCDVSRE